MTRRLLGLLLISAAAQLVVRAQAPAPVTAIHAIDPRAYTDPAQWAFLSPILEHVEVVSLGEPIHMTHEFPLVRLGIIKHLNEHMGFHVLAMEGSVGDAWVTQDWFLNSARGEQDARDAQLGLFGLWNTPEIRTMFEYEASSWATPTPFYITAYDIQPGTGRGTPRDEMFRLLVGRLRAYAAAPDGFDEAAWIGTLTTLTRGCNDYEPANRDRVIAAIALLEAWITRAAPAVTAKFPALPHGSVLTLLPDNLRASVALCDELTNGTHPGYKATRDTHAAEFAQRLKAAVPGEKLMLWAHLSHVFHNAEHGATSVGQTLHEALGPRLYTIMPMAEGGGAIVIYADDRDDIGYGRVHGERGDLGQRLSGLSSGDYFLNLRDPAIANDPLFTTPQPVTIEAFPARLAIARDFDGIVWIKTLHAPDFPVVQLLAFSAMHYETELEVAGVCLVAVAIGWPVLAWRRRRRRRANVRQSVG